MLLTSCEIISAYSFPMWTDEAIIKAFKLFESKICSLDTNSAKKLLVELFLIKVIITDKNIDIILDADKITNMVMGQ